jgi:peptidoglycan/LPS O-acetylase OafA/YrhL
LRYEWFFYGLLPLLAFAVGIVPPLLYILLALASWFFLPTMWQLQSYHEMFFLGGIAASLLVRLDFFCQFSTRKIASLLLIACLVLSVMCYSSAYATGPLILLSIVFSLIAGGNNLFGLLTCSFSRLLGEMCYSIYLLHGMVLYVTFTFFIGIGRAKLLSPFEHWLTVLTLTPALILVCYCSFVFIERPPMLLAARFTNWQKQKRIKVAAGKI